MSQIAYQETVVPLGSKAETCPIAAYERGITDGGWHESGRKVLGLRQINQNSKRWSGWVSGFELGIKLRRFKERMG